MPYDQAAVDAALDRSRGYRPRIPTMFPDEHQGSRAEGDYSARRRSGRDKAGFDEQVASFAKAVTDVKGKIKDRRHAEGGVRCDRQDNAAVATRPIRVKN